MPSIKQSDLLRIRSIQLLLIVGPLVTLIVNPWTNYDPISLPKLLALSSVSFCLFFLAYASRDDFLRSIPKLLKLLAIIFIVSMLLTLGFSGAPLNQQIWGSFGRNTGLLTYFSLIAVLLSCVWLRSHNFYARLTWMFFLTSIPMTVYCIAQFFGKDPIPWSEFNTFGTLGNINFLSAFLGMTSVAGVIYSLDRNIKKFTRLFFVALVAVDLALIYSTGSIQGPVVFVVGICAFTLVRISYFRGSRRNILLLGFSSLLVSLTYLMFQALQNLGPLARIIYQPSVAFRGDYIHAGWEMTLNKPIFGVGMDSYGDWYRETRGEISTLRTGPDRISNTAHNIFLDISSNGGVVLGITYLMLVALALFSSLRVIRLQENRNSYFVVSFSVWIAYQVQALVSINQIGVGIWGWIFTGMLIGTSLLQKQPTDFDSKFLRRREFKGTHLNPAASLLAISGFAIGFIVSGIPTLADSRYRYASDRGDLTSMVEASKALGSTQFHRELTLDFALRNNRVQDVKQIAEGLVADYPRSFFGWRVLSVASASSPEERARALRVVRGLDPFNPDLRG